MWSVSGLCGRIWTLGARLPAALRPGGVPRLGPSAGRCACCSRTGPSRARTAARRWSARRASTRSTPTARMRLRALWTVIGPFERAGRRGAAGGGGAAGEAERTRWDVTPAPQPSARARRAPTRPANTVRRPRRDASPRSRPARYWCERCSTSRRPGTGTGSTAGAPAASPSISTAWRAERPRTRQPPLPPPRSCARTAAPGAARGPRARTTTAVGAPRTGPSAIRPPANATHASAPGKPWAWPHHQCSVKAGPQFFSAYAVAPERSTVASPSRASPVDARAEQVRVPVLRQPGDDLRRADAAEGAARPRPRRPRARRRAARPGRGRRAARRRRRAGRPPASTPSPCGSARATGTSAERTSPPGWAARATTAQVPAASRQTPQRTITTRPAPASVKRQ